MNKPEFFTLHHATAKEHDEAVGAAIADGAQVASDLHVGFDNNGRPSGFVTRMRRALGFSEPKAPEPESLDAAVAATKAREAERVKAQQELSGAGAETIPPGPGPVLDSGTPLGAAGEPAP